MGELAWADPIIGLVFIPICDGCVVVDWDVGEPCSCHQCDDRVFYWPHIARDDSAHGLARGPRRLAHTFF